MTLLERYEKQRTALNKQTERVTNNMWLRKKTGLPLNNVRATPDYDAPVCRWRYVAPEPDSHINAKPICKQSPNTHTRRRAPSCFQLESAATIVIALSISISISIYLSDFPDIDPGQHWRRRDATSTSQNAPGTSLPPKNAC